MCLARKLEVDMAFTKTGDSVPFNVENKCCMCDKAAVGEKDSKLYCSEHMPNESDDEEKDE